MKAQHFVTALSLCAGVLLFSACANSLGTRGTIKIVSSLPLTGGDAAPAQSMAFAIQQAIEAHGARAGNYRIVYESLNDATAQRGAWDPGAEIANANRVANDPLAMVYMGTYNSSAAKLSIPIMNAAGPLLMISGSNTYPGLTKTVEGLTEVGEPSRYYPTGVRNYARTVPADDIQGKVNAKWSKELGAKTVYILDDRGSYGAGIANVFEAQAKALGLTILAHESINALATEYSAIATKIVNANPDLVFFGGASSSHAGLVWQALEKAGYKGKRMGPDGLLNNDFLKEAGAAAEGTYVTFGGLPIAQLIQVSPEGKKWHAAYVARFGLEPEAYATYAYEAALIVLQAIDNCVAKETVTRNCVRTQVFSTKDFKGILGATWSFDANGDTTLTTMTKNVVEDGKFKYIGLASSGQ